MIGKVIFIAVAISCVSAVPFGKCAPWDNQALNNIINSQPTGIPNGGINFPTPIAEQPGFNSAFPGPVIQNIQPAPIQTFQAQVPTQRIQHHIQFQNVPAQAIQIPNVQLTGFPGSVMQGPALEARIQNAEPRLQTIQTRIPTFQPRLPCFDSQISAFPAPVFQNAAPFAQPL